VDDRRVGALRAEALAERGYGDAAIRFVLEGEGLAAEIVAEALDRLEPEAERARRQVEKRGGGPKTVRWLAAHGFDEAALEAAVGFADEP
jgi:SOS response regulatory protein OraA/RecX